MRKRMVRTAAILLALIMCLGVVPAYADDAETADPSPEEILTGSDLWEEYAEEPQLNQSEVPEKSENSDAAAIQADADLSKLPEESPETVSAEASESVSTESPETVSEVASETEPEVAPEAPEESPETSGDNAEQAASEVSADTAEQPVPEAPVENAEQTALEAPDDIKEHAEQDLPAVVTEPSEPEAPVENAEQAAVEAPADTAEQNKSEAPDDIKEQPAQEVSADAAEQVESEATADTTEQSDTEVPADSSEQLEKEVPTETPEQPAPATQADSSEQPEPAIPADAEKQPEPATPADDEKQPEPATQADAEKRPEPATPAVTTDPSAPEAPDLISDESEVVEEFYDEISLLADDEQEQKPPTGATITDITKNAAGEYELHWKAVESAYGYVLYEYIDGGWSGISWYPIDAVSCTVNLRYGENIFSISTSDQYGKEYGIGEKPFTYIYAPPARIYGAGLNGEDESKISVNMYNYQQGLGLELYRKIDQGAYTLIKTYSAEELSAIDNYWFSYEDSITTSGTYTYRCRFFYGNTYGEYSEERAVPALLNPQVASISGDQSIITVSFSDTKDVVSYIVYYDYWNQIEIPAASVISFDLKQFTEYTGRHTIQISAKNDLCTSCKTEIHVCWLGTPVILGSSKTTSARAAVTWHRAEEATGYIIYKLGADNQTYNTLKTVAAPKELYYDKAVQPDTGYSYKLRAYAEIDGYTFYSGISDPVTVYTLPKSASVKVINKKRSSVKDALYMQSKVPINTAIYAAGYTGGTWAHVSPVSDFFDHKGLYNVAYEKDNYIYIVRIDPNTLQKKKTIKIKKKYPNFGGITCDSRGNYYVAWGQPDEKETKEMVTFALTKYTYKGKFVKTAVSYGKDSDTQSPFRAGNCSMSFDGDNLVVSYARHMYKSSDGLNHQSNAVFAVNSKTMKQLTGEISYGAYSSHSFDEQVLALNNGGVVFADLGDAYRRGMNLTFSSPYIREMNGRYVPFHFNGPTGQNFINAQLGGIGETSSGIALVGVSGKSLQNTTDKMQVFLQVIDPLTGQSVIKGKTRTGTVANEEVTDTGVLWLTDYKNGEFAYNPQAVIADHDRIIVTWQKYGENQRTTYYAVVSASGTYIQKPTRIKDVALNGTEELKYKDGYIYWTTGAGDKLLTVNKLAVDDGKALPKKGWNTLYGKKYYVDSKGNVVTGWKTIKGKKYYFDEAGQMVTGKQKINGKTYKFNKNGVLVK